MKRILTLLATVCMLSASQAQVAPQLQVKELKLQNGMTVWLNEDHTQPKVFGAVVVRAGAKDCPNTGIAHYFEHIMFKGTDRLGTTDYAAERPWLDSISAQYDLLSQTQDAARRADIQRHINELSLRAADYVIPNEFNRLVSRYGGSGLNAATSFDMTFYYNTFLPQFIEQWCWLNSERLLKPVFRGFQGELENVYEEKNRSADGLMSALEKVQATVFKEQPYAYPILGSTDNLKNPRLSDMEDFFRKYYVAPNMGLILCGDITPNTALTALLERTFGRVQTGPVPQRPASPMPPVATGEMATVTLPIPIVKAEALVYSGPLDYEADAAPLEIANQLLSNGKAGMLDSLMNEHVVMAAGLEHLSLNDAGIEALYIIPKIPFGKMDKARQACLDQLERLKQGQFSDAVLQAVKQEVALEAEQELETIGRRSDVLIDLFSRGRTIDDYLQRISRLKRVTRDDVMRVARKYYGANYVRLVKKYGTPDKETLRQPGYKPIQPKNVDAKSSFALQLEQLPVADDSVRLLDFGHDVLTTQLSPHATLYYKENPVNDIFTFALRYRNGTQNDPRLEPLADYITQLGTDSLTKQQLEQAWQRLGVTMEVVTGEQSFAFALQGRDEQLPAALQLLSHLMGAAKGDKQALDQVKQARKVEDKSFGKTKDGVLDAITEWVAYGQRSSYLTRLSARDVKQLTSDALLSALADLQQYDCDLFYCGRLPVQSVALSTQQYLPLSRCQRPQPDAYRPLQAVSEPTVYFYHVPKSRQNFVVTYEQLPAMPTAQKRTTQQLWARYFGGGMSSVLFQNIREFRSLAYSTYGRSYVPSLALHPDAPLAYTTLTGTQADKTLQAMQAVDSLLHQLPMKQENLEAARQELLSGVNNNYPDFRHVGYAIANLRRVGYDSDPSALLVQQLPALSARDVQDFHQRHIAPNQRVWLVVGDRKRTDLKALEKYGKVVELVKDGVYK